MYPIPISSGTLLTIQRDNLDSHCDGRLSRARKDPALASLFDKGFGGKKRSGRAPGRSACRLDASVSKISAATAPRAAAPRLEKNRFQ